MYKEDLALNNLQWLICYKTPIKPKKILSNRNFLIYKFLKHNLFFLFKKKAINSFKDSLSLFSLQN